MPPLTLMVKPASSLCNMRCAYCFYADIAARRETPSYGVMTEDTLRKLLQRAFTYAEGTLSIIFQGGEPTLAGKAFYRRLLALEDALNTRRIPVRHSLQTNGYALDAEWMDIFRAGRFLVGVSVDGTQAIHDACRVDAAGQPTHARIAEGIRLLQAARVEYNVLCVVTQAVAEQPKQVFKALAPHGFVQFIPCLDALDGTPSPWSLQPQTYGQFLIDTYDLYEQAMYAGHPVSVRTFDNWVGMLLGYPPDSCAMAGRCGTYFLIEADGSAYPCDFYVLDAWRLGNIHDASFFRMAKSPVAAAFRDASIPLPAACHACPYLSLCRGGCKRDREPLHSDTPSLNRLCAAHRAFFDARLPALRRLAQHVGKMRGR